MVKWNIWKAQAAIVRRGTNDPREANRSTPTNLKNHGEKDHNQHTRRPCPTQPQQDRTPQTQNIIDHAKRAPRPKNHAH